MMNGEAMNVTFDDKQPIFQQVADIIEDDILNGTFHVDEQILSVAQFSQLFQINPATVVKGIALLVNEGILYKKKRAWHVCGGGCETEDPDEAKRPFLQRTVDQSAR